MTDPITDEAEIWGQGYLQAKADAQVDIDALTAERDAAIAERKMAEQARENAKMGWRQAEAQVATLTQQRDRYAAALREHAKPLGEWDMLWVAPDGTMPGRVADAHWARAHIDALLAALEENDE